MFEFIVVLREGSTRVEQGLDIAERVARVTGGTILSLQDFPARPASSPHEQSSTLQRKDIDAVFASMSPDVPHAAQSQPSPGKEAWSALVSGPQVLIILEVEHVQESNLIKTLGTTEFERWIPKSMAGWMEQVPSMPILILHDGGTVLASSSATACPLTAIVALDGSHQAEAAISSAAHLVTSLTTPEKGALHLTRVVQRPGVDEMLQDQAQRDPQPKDQAIREATDYLCQISDALQSSLEGEFAPTITWSISVGSDVASALIGVAEKGYVHGGTCLFCGCNLLVLKRDGIRGGAPGSVIKRLFASTNLPFLLV